MGNTRRKPSQRQLIFINVSDVTYNTPCVIILPPDLTPLLPEKKTKWIQSSVGTFLYYGRAVDSTILPALNDISSSQAKPTETNSTKSKHVVGLSKYIPRCSYSI